MKQPDDLGDLRAAIAADMANAGAPRQNVKFRILVTVAALLFAVTAVAAGTRWYQSNQSRSQAVGSSIDESQWTGQEPLNFRAARTAVDQWLAGQEFEMVPLTEAPASAQELAQEISVKKAPLEEQTWYRSPPLRGEPFYVVTFVHSSSTDWENIRAEYFGCFVVWEFSGFRWNVDANAEMAQSFLHEARQWWEETKNQWER